jgi:DNA-binding transcriptional regulator YdaS (Cro superfamily)
MKEEIRHKLKKHFGNQEKIAHFLGNKPATVSYWLRGRYPIPVKYAKMLADESGVSFYDLRPDIPKRG